MGENEPDSPRFRFLDVLYSVLCTVYSVSSTPSSFQHYWYHKMKQHLLTLGMALAFLFVASSFSSADDPPEFETILMRALSGDATARAQILRGGEESITALEESLGRTVGTDETRVRELVELLDAEDYQTRKEATIELMSFPSTALSLLETLAEHATSPETKFRLFIVIEAFDGRESRSDLILDLLGDLYVIHAASRLPEVTEALAANPRNEHALFYVKHVPIREVRGSLDLMDEESRIRFLLAKKYIDPDASTIDQVLRDSSGLMVLKLAEETYWPIELEPLEEDGAYHWAARAESLEGNRAQHVIKISIDLRDDKDKLVHFKGWREWVYLWSYETPHREIYHGLVLGIRKSRRVRPENCRQLPEGVEVPHVRMSEREKVAWAGGRAFEWARELVPAEYVNMMRFRANRYDPVAEVLSTP